jgi:hypothetical protein
VTHHRRKRKYHSHRSNELVIVCELEDSYHSFVSFSLPVRACVGRWATTQSRAWHERIQGNCCLLPTVGEQKHSCFLSVRRTVYTQMLIGHTTIDSFVERSIDSEPTTTTRRMKERMEAAAAILIRRTTYDRSAGSPDRCRYQMVMLQQQLQQRHYDDGCRCHPYSQGMITWKTLIVTIFLMVFLQQQQFQTDGTFTQADSHVGTWIMDFVATSSSSSPSSSSLSFPAVIALVPIRPVTTTTMTKATLRRIDFNNNKINIKKYFKSFSSSHVALLPRPPWMAKVLSMSKENHDDTDDDGPLFYNDFESYGDSGSDNSKRTNKNANPDNNDSDDDDDDIDDDDDVLASSNQDQLLGDWRSFRRKLAAQERMTETKLSTNLQQQQPSPPRVVSSSTDNNSTSTTGSSPPETSQQQQRTTSSSTTATTISSATIHSWSSGGGGTATSTTTSNNHKSPNEITLEQQNEKLAMEYHTDVWAHEIATVRVKHNVFFLAVHLFVVCCFSFVQLSVFLLFR